MIVGFCCDEVNPFGPVQLYVAPAIVDAAKFNVAPEQSGALLDAVGDEGAEFMVTLVVAMGLTQPFTVAVTEYTPLAAVVAFVIVGFC